MTEKTSFNYFVSNLSVNTSSTSSFASVSTSSSSPLPTSFVMSSSNSSSFGNKVTCEPIFRFYLVVVFILLIVGIIWNASVLYAIAIRWNRLKRNLVYIYVINVTTANIVLGIHINYTILIYLIPFESYSVTRITTNLRYESYIPGQRSLMNWWAFRKSLVIGLFLVMNGSVVALAQGVAENTLFIGRAGGFSVKGRFAQSTTTTTDNEGNKKLLKKRKAVAITTIFLTWVVPFIYALIGIGWNCIEKCQCLPAFYSQDDPVCMTGNSKECSNVWHPMNNYHIVIGFCIWVIQCTIIIIMLCYTIKKYKASIKPTNFPVEMEEFSTNRPNGENATRNSQVASGGTLTRMFMFHSKPKSLHPVIKLLVSLSVTSILCTTPIVCCFAADVAANHVVVSYAVIIPAGLFLYVYCLSCPAFLIAYMPGLRSVVASSLCAPCTTTAVTTVARNRVRGISFDQQSDN